MSFLRCTLVFLLWSSSLLKAECECLWQGSFNTVQGGTDLVVSATVNATKGNSIDLSVDRSLRGGNPQQLRVWLHAKDYCRPTADTFPVGSRWVMALHEITSDVPGGFDPNTPNVSYGRLGDYSLSSCGGYWLTQTDNWVSGNLIKAPRWARDPEMTPVLLDLIDDYVNGKIDDDALLAASREDPAARELILDTKAFLREQGLSGSTVSD